MPYFLSISKITDQWWFIDFWAYNKKWLSLTTSWGENNKWYFCIMLNDSKLLKLFYVNFWLNIVKFEKEKQNSTHLFWREKYNSEKIFFTYISAKRVFAWNHGGWFFSSRKNSKTPH